MPCCLIFPSVSLIPMETGNVYISNLPFAQRTNLIKEKNIGAIITIGDSPIHTVSHPHIHATYQILCLDDSEMSLYEHFEPTYNFINENLSNKKNVLVHCFAGYSRSPTIVIAYMLKQFKMNVFDAYSYVYRYRRCRPNDGFWNQLIRFQEDIDS